MKRELLIQKSRYEKGSCGKSWRNMGETNGSKPRMVRTCEQVILGRLTGPNSIGRAILLLKNK
jgi:hypothetical protein